MSRKSTAHTAKTTTATLSRQSHALAIVALTVAVLTPFCVKPLHIDDTYYLRIAEQILRNPFDYYGFDITWYETSKPVYETHNSPPLANFYMALIIAVFGVSEIALHMSFLVPALGVGLGTYTLAQRWTSRPALAAACTLLTPAVWVSATGLMLDIPMLALYVCGLSLWVHGVDLNRRNYLIVAAVVAGLAAWTKYFGISVVGLYAVYAIKAGKEWQKQLVWLTVPVAMLLGEQLYGFALYDRFLLWNAASFVGFARADAPFYTSTLVGLSFVGGGMVTCLLPLALTSVRLAVATVLSTIILSGVLVVLPAQLVPGNQGIDYPLYVLAQYAAFITLGALLAGQLVREYRRKRDAASLVLLIWTAGTFTFAAYLNWSISIRTVMPLAPAAAILAARCFEEAPLGGIRSFARAGVAAGAMVALAVNVADYRWADSIRDQALHYIEQYNGTRTFFQGHWGFQYYMERGGFEILDYLHTELQPGDTVIVPRNAVNVSPIPRPFVRSARHDEVVTSRCAGTMCMALGAGFYGDIYGPLPYAFGPVPPDEYYIYTIARAGRPFVDLPPR